MNTLVRPRLFLSRLSSFISKNNGTGLHQLSKYGSLYGSSIVKSPVSICGILQNNQIAQSLLLPSCSQPLRHITRSHENYAHHAASKKSLLQRIKEGVGLRAKMRYKGQVMQRSGLRLYLSCLELVDYDEFFSVFELPDTFNSWFRITEIHLWMVMVRLSSEGEEGQIVRNNLIKSLWEDVDKRIRKLGTSSSSRTSGKTELSNRFRASIFAYDEGLLSDDKVLAGAIWRNFFEMKCEDAEKIAQLVGYVRKQIHHIDTVDAKQVLGKGVIAFLPLSGDQLNSSSKKIIEEIFNRT